MSTRIIEQSIERCGIDNWSDGYFSINKDGEVVCLPDSECPQKVSLMTIVERAKKLGVTTPMIIRFPQIIKAQLLKMHRAFSHAIEEFEYKGRHFGVFPFKVNQRREFIDAVVNCGKDVNWGLEVGSKTEFMAALSYDLNPEALFICNGFKDKEFIDMAFLAAQMGRKILLVVEGPDELELISSQFEKSGLPKSQCPDIGLRVRLYSRGSGKWAKSSGETSKFGLTTIELMLALKLLIKTGLDDKLRMLHFHIGSQVTAINRFKNALREAGRVYAKIKKMGFNPSFLNIGGGVGVDYDGSHSAASSSVNYTLQEFTNDAIYVVGEVCNKEEVSHPDIVTESGRIIAAYHSVVVTDIREVQGEETLNSLQEEVSQNSAYEKHKNISELEYALQHMNSKNFSEYYHDSMEHHEDLFTLFNLGYVSLSERAIAEELFHKICIKALHFASLAKRPNEEFEDLQKLKVSKYLANFSIFQSIPDAWSIDQLFPVLPLSRHNERPSHKATIVDITCDSDGCLDRFIDSQKEKRELDLHKPNGQPYYLGFFLVGAYQESLANEHNLFGAINEIEVFAKKDGSWRIQKTTEGDPILELLICRNYSQEELLHQYASQLERAIENGQLNPDLKHVILKKLKVYLQASPYLKEK